MYLDIYLSKKFLVVRVSWTRDREKLRPGQLQLIEIPQLTLHAFIDTQKQMLFKILHLLCWACGVAIQNQKQVVLCVVNQ